MGKRYVKCDNCEAKIYEHSQVVQERGRCGIYCSFGCYAIHHSNHIVLELTENVVENSLTEFEIEEEN